MIKLITIILLFTFSVAVGVVVSPTIESFNGGQVSELMEARVTFPKYSSSCRTIENMFVTVQGPVERRPGTKYIATQKSSSATGRLVAFERSSDDSFVLLFEDQVIRLFKDGAQILDGVGTEDISGLNNIVAHWLMNEFNGTNVADDDGGTHDMTSTADTSLLTATGKVGTGCFDLDGQYAAELADHADFSFTDDSDDSAFSVACWGFVSEQDSTQVLLSKWRDQNISREWRFSLESDRKLQLHLADTTGNIESDRVAQWFLNDNAASTAVDDAVASVPHDGVMQSVNTSTISSTDRNGNANGSLDFGGVDYAVVPTNAALSFNTAGTDDPFSISAWIFVSETAVGQTIICKTPNSNVSGEWLFYLTGAEQLGFRLIDDTANVNIYKTTDNALSEGWHFAVATYGGAETAADITLYVDNVTVATTAVENAAYLGMDPGAEDVAIGARNDGNTKFQDKLDNITIFDKELSVAEINVLWNQGLGTETTTGIEVSAITDDVISNGWHFFTCTYSAPADETTAADGIILYVDGVAVDSTATNNANYNAMQNRAEEIRIGSERNSADNANEKFWGDKIDEMSVYSDVLTPTEVASLFSTSALEITTPYLTADLSEIIFTKNDDVMYITHSDHRPKQLTSTAASLWTLADVDFQTGPFLPENDTAITVTPSATTGTGITLTASSNIFKVTSGSDHVDSIWAINQVGGNPAITGNFTANGVSIATSEFSGGYGFTTSGTWVGTVTLQRSTNGGSSWRTALGPFIDTNFDNPAEIEEDGAIYRAVMSDFTSGTCTYNITITDDTNKGVVRITGVASGTSATATVLNTLVSTKATTRWREGYWSDFRGWPKTVTVHQQRLVFGGSESFPQEIWFGKQDPDDYSNFLEGTLDTSSFTVALEGQNPIRWLLSQDYLLIGTSGTIGKWGEQSKAVTPTSPNYQEQTRHGSAAIQAGLGGDAVLYVERGSRIIRQFSFDLQVDKYLSPPLTILAPEITESGIKEIAFQLRPSPTLWCVLNNGNIATLTYRPEQSVIAWAKQSTDGNFTSVAVIPGQTGTNEDEVWVIAERDINSSTVFYVEQFQPRVWGSDDNDAWFVDSGITYSGSATDTFTGASHLEGETVSIYADKLIESPEVVVSGGFTIDNAASRVLAGMAYTSKLETLPLVVDPQDRATNKKIMRVWFDLYKTGYLRYGANANATTENMNFKNNLDADNTATAQDLITSTTRAKNGTWPWGTMKKQTIYVESAQPMPLTIRSLTPEYQIIGN